MNAPAVPFDKHLDDGQPDTDPALPRGRRLGLGKPLKEMWQKLRGDALARIGDLNLRLRPRRGEPNLDAPSPGR